MKPPFETGNLVAPVQKRLLAKKGKSILLERMINEAGLAEYLLAVTRFKKAVFILSPGEIQSIHPPKIERLSMVFPVSFEFEWDILVKGYYQVRYRNLPNPLPQQIDPFRVRYTSVVTPSESGLSIKNERITLA